MFSLKKTLLSAVLCAALTTPTHSSAFKDENTSTNSTSLSAAPAATITWDPAKTAAAREDNKTNPLLTLHQLTYQEIMTDLFAEGDIKGLSSLLTTCHKLHDQVIHTAVHAAFRGVLKTHAKMLEPWAALLFHKDAKMHHLIWARQMLKPENIKRLGVDLLERLTLMPDKAKALALAAHAIELFPGGLCGAEYDIIGAAVQSSRPLSSYAALGAACRELFTEGMSGISQGKIIAGALRSSRPLHAFGRVHVACKEFFSIGNVYSAGNKSRIIGAVLSLTDAQIQNLLVECKARTWGFDQEYFDFIQERLARIDEVDFECKQHLFTKETHEEAQSRIVDAFRNSSFGARHIPALGATCKEHFFRENMSGEDQATIIENIVLLEVAQIQDLVGGCRGRPSQTGAEHRDFIVQSVRRFGPDILSTYFYGRRLCPHSSLYSINTAVSSSSRSLPELIKVAVAYKQHLCLGAIDEDGFLLVGFEAACQSARPLSEYEALGAACREHLFTRMGEEGKGNIIAAAIRSPRPLSEYPLILAACREHLFMKYIHYQVRLITAVLASSRPLSSFAALGAAFRTHLFVKGIYDLGACGWILPIIERVLPLSDEQIAQLVTECKARPNDDACQRHAFIKERSLEMLEKK